MLSQRASTIQDEQLRIHVHRIELTDLSSQFAQALLFWPASCTVAVFLRLVDLQDGTSLDLLPYAGRAGPAVASHAGAVAATVSAVFLPLSKELLGTECLALRAELCEWIE